MHVTDVGIDLPNHAGLNCPYSGVLQLFGEEGAPFDPSALNSMYFVTHTHARMHARANVLLHCPFHSGLDMVSTLRMLTAEVRSLPLFC